ncbi:hypothetical protein CC1G_08693 [Coprinopsis cinerea okayama7|uniref:Tail specific protease domain-containing protein n=1 Tax=Coprinopsis cinerea (strain Okayama-7 / 130 / ATCC MYA-4618 / FGSC 9003) TaxID=240176 RepID=A8NZH3_COPC7|nr:hypothetical protein CC1G_08693 [Coprinopsis cinerea okayama7\|eukprot:XP_001837680.2 hypothetical protein CC1G_08693 [Coprinopsis cinerea okayama7\
MKVFESVLGISLILSIPTVLGAPAAIADDVEPCGKLAGRTHARPLDVLACYKSWPFNETIRQNVLTTLSRVFDFYTFENYYLDSPHPFEGSTSDIRAHIDRINNTVYENDYDFHKDVLDFTLRLNDAHTRYVPQCYTSYQSVLPTPITSLYDPETDEHSIYVAPNAVELMTLMGTNYTDYFDEIGFDWKRLAGAKVLSIDDMDPYDYVDKIANTISGNYLDHGIRVNLVYTSYRIASNEWSQRVGDLAGPIEVTRPDLPMRLIPVNSTEPEDVRVPFYALFIGYPFEDRESFWTINCAANENTNGVDFKEFFPLPDPEGRRKQEVPPVRHPKGDVLDPSKHISLALPDPYLPTVPSTEGSTFVIKSYLLPDNKTGVMYIGSFAGNFDQFQLDVYLAVNDLKKKGASRLLIDLSNNGGGFLCLGQYLYAYLAADEGYGGFTSTTRSHPLAEKVIDGVIGYRLNYQWSFYAGDNWAFTNDTQMPSNYHYLKPSLTTTVNGKTEKTSQLLHDRCRDWFVVNRPETPPFDLSQVAIFGNGACGSTCAMFSAIMREKFNTKVAIVGGKPGEPMEYKGIAGNQVLEWWDLDSELKTTGAKPDPLAPPDLLVRANIRHNWRTAYSSLNESQPLAYRSDPATHRLWYTKDTYAHPQNLWMEAAKLLFDTDEA